MPLISEHIRETTRIVLVYFVNPLLFLDVHTFMKLVIGHYSYFNVILKVSDEVEGLLQPQRIQLSVGINRVWSLSNTPTSSCSIHILYSSPYSAYLNFLHSKIWAIQGTPRYVIFSSQLLAIAFCMPILSLCFMPLSLQHRPTKYGLCSRVHYEHRTFLMLQIRLS